MIQTVSRGHNVRPGAQAFLLNTAEWLASVPLSNFSGMHRGADRSSLFSSWLDIPLLLHLDFRTYTLVRSLVAIVGYDLCFSFDWVASFSSTSLLQQRYKSTSCFRLPAVRSGIWSMAGINILTSPSWRILASLLMGGTIVVSLLFL